MISQVHRSDIRFIKTIISSSLLKILIGNETFINIYQDQNTVSVFTIKKFHKNSSHYRVLDSY